VSRDIVDTSSLGLVVPARVEPQSPQKLPVLAEEPYVEIGDQSEDPEPGRGHVQHNVVQTAVVAA